VLLIVGGSQRGAGDPALLGCSSRRAARRHDDRSGGPAGARPRRSIAAVQRMAGEQCHFGSWSRGATAVGGSARARLRHQWPSLYTSANASSPRDSRCSMIRRSSPASRSYVLASLRALHLDPSPIRRNQTHRAATKNCLLTRTGVISKVPIQGAGARGPLSSVGTSLTVDLEAGSDVYRHYNARLARLRPRLSP
jgi:hypothetical protein